MAYWRHGEKEKGREWYAKALQSVETACQPTRRELRSFDSEAVHLLGISDPKLPSKSEDSTSTNHAGKALQVPPEGAGVVGPTCNRLRRPALD